MITCADRHRQASPAGAVVTFFTSQGKFDKWDDLWNFRYHSVYYFPCSDFKMMTREISGIVKRPIKKHIDAFKLLHTIMKDVNSDNRQIIKAMQEQIDYLMEFIAVQGEIIEQTTGCRQPELSEEQKRRLAYRGKKLNEFMLGQISQFFSTGTVHGWYRELIAKKYDSTGANQKKRGRKPISREIIAEVLMLAEHNTIVDSLLKSQYRHVY